MRHKVLTALSKLQNAMPHASCLSKYLGSLFLNKKAEVIYRPVVHSVKKRQVFRGNVQKINMYLLESKTGVFP